MALSFYTGEGSGGIIYKGIKEGKVVFKLILF